MEYTPSACEGQGMVGGPEGKSMNTQRNTAYVQYC